MKIFLLLLALVFISGCSHSSRILDKGPVEDTGITVTLDDASFSRDDTTSEFSPSRYFKSQLEFKIIQNFGQPIEGFEPFMFLREFSGLNESDFNNVRASLGVYHLIDGKLEFTHDET